ncbi:MAG TPA: DUF3857 domain-containing protein [Spirochaetota bacterium]|nr:DUF3857 domain-containing protein [Spirochaetota bacterium]
MKRYPAIRAIFFCLMIQAGLTLSGSVHSEARSLDEFLKEKSAGNYAGALDALGTAGPDLNDPASIEVSLFMVGEMMQYPELHDRAGEVLGHIASVSAHAQPYLADRVRHLRTRLCLSRGDLKGAEALQKSLAFLDFQAMGPFKNSSVEDFERSYRPERSFDRRQVCAGKFSPVTWFSARPDRTGSISFNELFPDTGHSFFYLTRTITAPRSGEYLLIMGKTGYTDLWLDNRKIFSDRIEHGFCHDQYFIRVLLPAGPHRLLIKAGDSSSGIQVSLRMAAVDGAGAPAGSGDAAGQGSLLGITFFPALAGLLNISDPGPEELFKAGYLFLASRLGDGENNRGIPFLSGVPAGHRLYSTACRCIALAHGDIEARDRYLNRSIQADPDNIESLRDLADIKISRDFVYEAYPLIAAIKRIRPLSPWHLDCSARLCTKLRWLPEARRHAEALKRSFYHSVGMHHEALIYRHDSDHAHAILDQEGLVRLDYFNLSWHIALIDSYEKTGNLEAAEQALLRIAALYPNNSALKLRLAGIVEKMRGPVQSLPYLTAAMEAAPGNRDILRALGTAYHKIGKEDLAVYYLDQASRSDPDNHELRQYLRIIKGEVSELERHALKDEISLLAASAMKYRDEPAVNILDETVIAVNTDGSFERRVRKIVMVNDRSEIRNYSTRYIVLDPERESAENVTCAIVRDLARREVTERYRKPLSRPESRLYYNLEALVIPVPSLTPGDIIDLSYVIRNREGADYRHYFGEKITAGDGHRTMRFRAVLVHPAVKPVYCHLKGMEQNSLSVGSRDRKRAQTVTMENIPPLKKEQAMPDASELLPAVYFTSHRSWDEFFSWYRSFLKNRVRIDADMKALVKKIFSDTREPLDRVRAIYGFVSGSIRYVGFEFGVGGIQPRGTDVTFHTRMGDCKDVSLLLVALLREAGIDARLALIRTRDRGRAYLAAPFAGEFNHAICYVNIGKGFFLDATAPDTGIRELPADDRAVDAFVMDDKGWKFITTGGDFYYRNLVEIHNDVTITNAGDAEIRRSLLKQGETAPEARARLMDRERYVQYLNEFWNSYFPGSSVRDLAVSSMAVDEPVRSGYTVSVPGFSRNIDRTIIFDASPVRYDLYDVYALSPNRTYPVVLAGGGTARTVTRFAIPGGYRVSRLPRNERFNGDDYSAAFNYSYSGRTITVESVIDLKKTFVETAAYRRFREFTRLVDRKERERIILSPASP